MTLNSLLQLILLIMLISFELNLISTQTIAIIITGPPIRLCLKDSKIWRHSFYRMQTQLVKWKTILRPVIYLIGSKPLIEWITYAFITLNIRKRNGWVSLYFLAFKRYCFISMRVTRGVEGENFPCPFSKIEKKCPNFWENALIVVTYG